MSKSTAVQQDAYPATLPLALLAFHRNVGPIYKASQAKYGAFADLQTVLDAVTPALLDQGLVLSQCIDTAADGAMVLRASLIHAPTGETLDSAWPIPNLQSLLDRVHELRQQTLDRFPLDLNLAAIGALPPVLPPRNAEAGSELPPPPPRQPGVRLDDQLKGLYTLLGQLGTTTNPLHALGGVITYTRRYQILSLLSLAAEDDDSNGHAAGQGREQAAPPHQAQAQLAPPAAPARRGRQRSATAAPTPTPAPAPAQSAAAPQPTPPAPQPAPQAAEHADQPPAPQQPAAPAPEQAAAAAPVQAALAERLATQEVQGLIAEIRTLSTEHIPQVVAAFRQRFAIPAGQMVSDYIQTAEHAAFIRQQIAAMQQPVAV